MRHRLRRLASNVSYSFYRAPTRLRTWSAVRITRRAQHIDVVQSLGDLAGDVAIVAVFPRMPLRASVERLLASLKAEGFVVVLVVNESPDATACVDRWRAHADHILRRPNIGRDFGAYQAGTRYLRARTDRGSLRRVAYLNDSVFWPVNTAQAVHAWLQRPTGPSAMFVNLEARPHMQSFAVVLPGEALFRPQLQSFWDHYYPSDLRMQAIRKGEVALSRAVVRDGGLISAFVTWHRLDAALDGDWDHLPVADAYALRSAAGPPIDSYLTAALERATTGQSAVRFADLAKIVLTTRNASAPLGPTATRTLGAPFKLDLVRSGFLTLADFESTLAAAGTEPDEIEEVMSLISTTGSMASAVGFRRLWRDFGHY